MFNPCYAALVTSRVLSRAPTKRLSTHSPQLLRRWLLITNSRTVLQFNPLRSTLLSIPVIAQPAKRIRGRTRRRRRRSHERDLTLYDKTRRAVATSLRRKPYYQKACELAGAGTTGRPYRSIAVATNCSCAWGLRRWNRWPRSA